MKIETDISWARDLPINHKSNVRNIDYNSHILSVDIENIYFGNLKIEKGIFFSFMTTWGKYHDNFCSKNQTDYTLNSLYFFLELQHVV